MGPPPASAPSRAADTATSAWPGATGPVTIDAATGNRLAAPVPATYYHPGSPMALGVDLARRTSGKTAGGLAVGVVGLGLVTWLLSLLTVFVGGFTLNFLFPVSPVLALLAAFFFVNVFWATSAYLKSNYYTCFYLWARECERARQPNPMLAPEPLRNVIGGAVASPGAWG